MSTRVFSLLSFLFFYNLYVLDGEIDTTWMFQLSIACRSSEITACKCVGALSQPTVIITLKAPLYRNNSRSVKLRSLY